MAATFVLNRVGLAAMLRTPQAVRAVDRIGELIEDEAIRISPVQTGRYVNSWYRRSAVGPSGAFSRVGNTAPHAKFLEFGTSRMRRQRILGRALDAVNLA